MLATKVFGSTHEILKRIIQNVVEYLSLCYIRIVGFDVLAFGVNINLGKILLNSSRHIHLATHHFLL